MNAIVFLIATLICVSLLVPFTRNKILKRLPIIEGISKRRKSLYLLILIFSSAIYSDLFISNVDKKNTKAQEPAIAVVKDSKSQAGGTQPNSSVPIFKIAKMDLTTLSAIPNYSQNLLKCDSDKNGIYWIELHTGERASDILFDVTLINELKDEIYLPFSAEAYHSIRKTDNVYWAGFMQPDNFQYKVFEQNNLNIFAQEPKELAEQSGIKIEWLAKSIQFSLNRDDLKFNISYFSFYDTKNPITSGEFSCRKVEKEQAIIETKRLNTLIDAAVLKLTNQISQAKQLRQSKKKI